MSEPQPRPSPVKAVLVTLAVMGCLGLATAGGLAFFMFYACASASY